jgi:hypothetical protein
MSFPKIKIALCFVLTNRIKAYINHMINKNIQTLKMKFTIIAFLLSIISINAETVILRSHDVVHGKITYQDALVLRMNDDLGKPLELQKNDILKVSYRDVKDAKEIKKIIEEEESKLPPEKRKKVQVVIPENRYTLLLRSAAVPGWGQWKAGNKWYAAAAFVGVVGAAGYAASSVQGFQKSQKSYETNTFNTVAVLSLSNLDNTSKIVIAAVLGARDFEPAANASTVGNNAIQGLGIVYAIQLMHSFYLGYKWEKANPNANTTIGKKAAFGEWNFNASPRQAYAPTAAGVSRETFYEVNYEFRF